MAGQWSTPEMAEVVFVEADRAEAAVLAALIRAAFEEYRGQLVPPSGAHEETADSLAHMLGGATRAVIARRGGQDMGCVLYEVDEGFVSLSRLAVLPEYRRQGIGQALVDHVEKCLRALGHSRVRLGVRLVLGDLTRWYERLGYCRTSLACHEGFSEPTFAYLEKTIQP